MKIKHLFGLAVIAAMTASCSSNEDLGTAGPGTGTNESGVGYATFSINLPTTSGTRAGSDPTFEDGDANEYDVFNATLLVFKKPTTTATSEGEYTFVEHVDLGSMQPWKNPNEPGVTTQAKITAKLSNVDKNYDYFALVLLNNGSGTDAKVNLPTDETTTYSAWNKAANATDKFDKTDKGFYMANAPLYNATDKNVTTLVAIDKNKIFPTEAQASSGDAAADIYVERGLAKVTLTEDTKAEKTVGATSSYAGDKVTISKWALDVTNKKTFPIHNVDGLSTDYEDIWKNDPAATAAPSTQRFVDNNSETLVKRVYWGKDPNYSNSTLNTDETARAAEFNYVTANTEVTADPTKPLYCLENTFNLANMMQGQTTRVIFKASYTPKGFTAADGKTFYKVGTSVALWKQKDLEDHIKAAVSKVISVTTTDDITIKLDAPDNNITAAGNHEIKKSNFSVTGHTVTDAEAKAVSDKVGLTEKAGISTYANGESYYIARIKHFGDALTPWTSGVYGDNNLAYLGRYGMLRNNWYELDVQNVSGPGYPDVPEVKPNTPDDEDDKYIKVSVKILKWAKRSQKVDL